jgi:hypothetical protein
LTSGIIASNSCFFPRSSALFLIHRSLHAAVDLLREPLRLVPYLPRQAHQLPVFLLHLLFLLLALAPAEPGNFHHPMSDRSQPIPQSCPLLSRQVADLFHDPGQHPRPIPQQTAVGRVMNVHFRHGCIDAHPPPFHHMALPGHLHQALMNLLHDFAPQRSSQLSQGLGVGHRFGPDAGEHPIQQVGFDLALQNLVAPVPYVLQHHQSQYHFRGRGIPPPLPTLRVPLPELLVDQVQQLFVFQDLVGFFHPRFHQRFRFPGEEDLTQVALAMP